MLKNSRWPVSPAHREGRLGTVIACQRIRKAWSSMLDFIFIAATGLFLIAVSCMFMHAKSLGGRNHEFCRRRASAGLRFVLGISALRASEGRGLLGMTANPRVAGERGVSEADVRALVQKHTLGRQFGFLEEPRVRVVELNLDLDAAYPRK